MSEADHDVLIKLVGSVADLKSSNNEKFADLKSDIQDLKDGHAAKIQDHEDRLRIMEGKITQVFALGTGALVILGVIQFLIGKYL